MTNILKIIVNLSNIIDKTQYSFKKCQINQKDYF